MNPYAYRTKFTGQLLTDRELEVLELSAKGLSAREIGDKLGISLDTTKTHIRRMLKRLNAKNRTHAVNIGWESGLLARDWRQAPRDAMTRLNGWLLPFMSSEDAAHITGRVTAILARANRLRDAA